jgi:hypothetical protein
MSEPEKHDLNLTFLERRKKLFPYSCSFYVDSGDSWKAQEKIVEWAIDYCRAYYPETETEIFETHFVPYPFPDDDLEIKFQVCLISRFRDLPIQARLSLDDFND